MKSDDSLIPNDKNPAPFDASSDAISPWREMAGVRPSRVEWL